MAKKNVTIEDVKKAKITIETEITKKMQDFEKTYGVKLGYINIKRKRDKKDKEAIPIDASTRKEMPIETVDINMDLDLIY